MQGLDKETRGNAKASDAFEAEKEAFALLRKGEVGGRRTRDIAVRAIVASRTGDAVAREARIAAARDVVESDAGGARPASAGVNVAGLARRAVEAVAVETRDAGAGSDVSGGRALSGSGGVGVTDPAGGALRRA